MTEQLLQFVSSAMDVVKVALNRPRTKRRVNHRRYLQRQIILSCGPKTQPTVPVRNAAAEEQRPSAARLKRHVPASRCHPYSPPFNPNDPPFSVRTMPGDSVFRQPTEQSSLSPQTANCQHDADVAGTSCNAGDGDIVGCSQAHVVTTATSEIVHEAVVTSGDVVDRAPNLYGDVMNCTEGQKDVATAYMGDCRRDCSANTNTVRLPTFAAAFYNKTCD